MAKTINGTVYIPVGIPASGKSTWFTNQGFDQTKVAFVSMDKIRGELTGDETDQTQNAMVAKLAKDRYKQALSLKVPIVFWDATSISKKYRRSLIDTAKHAGYEVVCIFFDIALDVAKERNANRERVVPEHVLDRMHKNLQTPQESEGFKRIEIIK